VIALVRDHLKPGEFFKKREEVSDGAFRRLARKCELDLLYRVARADSLGRMRMDSPEKCTTPRPRSGSLSERKNWLSISVRLRRCCWPSSDRVGTRTRTQMGEITRAVYDMQIEGSVTSIEEAKQAAQEIISHG